MKLSTANKISGFFSFSSARLAADLAGRAIRLFYKDYQIGKTRAIAQETIQEAQRSEMLKKLKQRGIELSRIFGIPAEEAFHLAQIENKLAVKLTGDIVIGTWTYDDGTGEWDDWSPSQSHPFQYPSYVTEPYSLSIPNLNALTQLDINAISKLPETNRKYGKYVGKDLNQQLADTFYEEIIAARIKEGIPIPKLDNYRDKNEVILDLVKG